MKKLILMISSLLVLLLMCVSCTSEPKADSTPEPTPAVVTPTPEPTATPEPELDNETEEERGIPEGFEELPVDITYKVENDLNGNGVIDQSEWEAWVSAHPEDINKDMVISAEEKGETQTPVETPKPAENTQKPTETPKPSNNNNSNTTKPVETPKPTPAPVVETPTPEPTPRPGASVEGTTKTEEELEQAREHTQEWADKIGGTTDPAAPGFIDPGNNPNINW